MQLKYLRTKFHCFSGPGCSSIGGGAFTELGPFYPKGDGRGLRRNSMSWNKGMTHSTLVFDMSYSFFDIGYFWCTGLILILCHL